MKVSMNDIEELRKKRNIGSKKVAEIKSKGEDASEEILELKKLSIEIKKLEKLFKSDVENIKPTTEKSNICSVDKMLYEKIFSVNGSEKNKKYDVSSENIITKLLETEIRGLEKESNVFPQCRLDWVMPWIKKNIKSTELHVVVVRDNGELIGIAYFKKSLKFGISFIKSIPTHYGDFYDFIIRDDYEKIIVGNIIINSLKALKANQIIIDQVNSFSLLNDLTEKQNFIKMINCSVYSVWLKDQTEEGLLGNLSKKMKASINLKLRKLESFHKIEILESSCIDKYIELVPEFRNIVVSRRGVDLSDEAYNRRLESLKGIHGSGCFTFFYLKVDNEIVAFRFGYTFKNVYFEWKSCHKSEFNKYSLGDLMTWMVLKKHMKNGRTAHNFMAGDYVYKQRWATKELTSINSKCFFFDKSVTGLILKQYQIILRPKLKRLKSYVIR
ncbi:GNAT family N-acetyltransferase [Neptunomonas japonica]|uniref:GNAT family N-acetyltransferase n=1 Tax=Neptunomonas japonica TaxID=417574 RepID=UPI0003F4B07C|nr:GNAT family N-acetyltransferase [Neptunomonas japonica]